MVAIRIRKTLEEMRLDGCYKIVVHEMNTGRTEIKVFKGRSIVSDNLPELVKEQFTALRKKYGK